MTDSKLKMEVPPQLREMAAKSVDQVEAALSSFMDAAGKSVALIPGPVTDMAKQTLSITEKNLHASFEHARKLMKAEDMQEVMQLQTEFLRNQLGAAREHFQQMTSGMASAAKDAGKETGS